MTLVVKPDKIPSDGRNLATLSLSDTENILEIGSCHFGEGVKKAMTQVGQSDRHVEEVFQKSCDNCDPISAKKSAA